MAVVIHPNGNITVDTISERNDRAIVKHRRDGMIVTVKDAIADVNAGPGIATYMWNESLSRWLLQSKETAETVSFETVELNISNGKVQLPNIPNSNTLWDIYILNSDNIMVAELRLDALTVTPSSVEGLSAYNGLKFRCTYAYGTITQQISTYVDDKLDVINTNITNVTNVVSNSIGTIQDFEGALNG